MSDGDDLNGDVKLLGALAAFFLLLGLVSGFLFAAGLSVARICQGMACWYHYLTALAALVVGVVIMAVMASRR